MLRIILIAFGLMDVVLMLLLVHNWQSTSRLGRALLAGLCFFWLPLFWGGAVVMDGMNDMKRVEFCGSCHVMGGYVDSLTVLDDESVPAAHFRHNRVPQETACYSCHTEYSMFGPIKAKIGGLKHVWVNYFGDIPEKIELYKPYENRDCLRCHEPAENYEDAHEDELEDIELGELTCLECHDVGHILEEGE